jgi:hypothetical protein
MKITKHTETVMRFEDGDERPVVEIDGQKIRLRKFARVSTDGVFYRWSWMGHKVRQDGTDAKALLRGMTADTSFQDQIPTLVMLPLLVADKARA